jgi:ribosomal subunit interface protein
MNTPLEITFHNMDHSDAVEARVRERVARLEKLFDRMTHCRVVVESPHQNHHKGKIYHVRIDIGLPGREDLFITRGNEDNHAHEDVYVAIRDAFDAAKRKLQDVTDKMSGKVKTLRGGKRRRQQAG